MDKEARKLGLICFASQAGKDAKTFSEALFREEVEVPIRAFLATGLLHMVFVVVPCNKESPDSEIPEAQYVPEAGMPPHVFSPTSQAVIRAFRHEHENGLVEVMDVWSAKPADDIHHLMKLMNEKGVKRIMVKFTNVDFPTLEKFEMFNDLMVGTHSQHVVFGAEFAPKNMLAFS